MEKRRPRRTFRALDETRGSILRLPWKTGCFKIPADVLPANEHRRVFVAIHGRRLLAELLPKNELRKRTAGKTARTKGERERPRTRRTHVEFCSAILELGDVRIFLHCRSPDRSLDRYLHLLSRLIFESFRRGVQFSSEFVPERRTLFGQATLCTRKDPLV